MHQPTSRSLTACVRVFWHVCVRVCVSIRVGAIRFNQIAKMARAVAAGMAQRGLKKGDVFAIISPNLPE